MYAHFMIKAPFLYPKGLCVNISADSGCKFVPRIIKPNPLPHDAVWKHLGLYWKMVLEQCYILYFWEVLEWIVLLEFWNWSRIPSRSTKQSHHIIKQGGGLLHTCYSSSPYYPKKVTFSSCAWHGVVACSKRHLQKRLCFALLLF